MQIVRQILSLSLLKVLQEQLLLLQKELCLLIIDCHHRFKQILYLFDILLRLFSVNTDVSDVDLKFCGPFVVAVLYFGLELAPNSLHIHQLSL